jgi:GntR family transcriptional regulator, arabinose operon transcriptional repressor
MDKMSKKISLIEKVKGHIKDDIVNGVFLPGQRIETIRALLKKYEVSHTTMAMAIKQLQEEGWIDSKVGHGTYVCAEPPILTHNADSQSRNIIYFVILSRKGLSGYHVQVLKSLQQLVAELNIQLKIVSAEDADALAQVTSDSKILGIIYNADVKHINTNVPAVSYGMCSLFSDSCFVQPDNYQGGVLCGDILLKHGHKNICYVSLENRKRSLVQIQFHQRYNGLCAAYELADYASPDTVYWHIKTAESRREVTTLLKRIKAREPGVPTALVAGNKFMALEIYMVAIGMGIKIPEDLSLISFIDRSENRDAYISNIDFSREAMARQVLSLILDAKNSHTALDNNKHLLQMFISHLDTVKDLTSP